LGGVWWGWLTLSSRYLVAEPLLGAGHKHLFGSDLTHRQFLVLGLGALVVEDHVQIGQVELADAGLTVAADDLQIAGSVD